MKNYTQLSSHERSIIEYLKKQNKSINFIAKELNRNKSTISRELKKNKGTLFYFAKDAQFTTDVNKMKSHQTKINQYQEFISFFEVNFEKKYNGVDVCVSQAAKLGIKVPTTQTVYNWINHHLLKIKAKQLLRPRFWWQQSNKYNGYLNDLKKMNEIPITYRPSEINERKHYGDFEIDLVLGTKKSKNAVLTFVDRKTRKAFVTKVENKKMDHINSRLNQLIETEKINVNSVTKDNGTEFNLLFEITKMRNIVLYTCHTYASCEKGSNENFNGLLRRAFPKGTNFDKVSSKELQLVVDKINKMPRKILGYKSAQELYEALG